MPQSTPKPIGKVCWIYARQIMLNIFEKAHKSKPKGNQQITNNMQKYIKKTRPKNMSNKKAIMPKPGVPGSQIVPNPLRFSLRSRHSRQRKPWTVLLRLPWNAYVNSTGLGLERVQILLSTLVLAHIYSFTFTFKIPLHLPFFLCFFHSFGGPLSNFVTCAYLGAALWDPGRWKPYLRAIAFLTCLSL